MNHRTHGAGWMHAAAAALLGLLMAGFAAGAAGAADKVSGEILAHRDTKQALRTRGAADRRQALLRQGIAGEHLDAEQCALYVNAPLTDAEVSALAKQGVTVHPTYVPPVAGKHPQGFYLATVRYTALDAVRKDARLLRLETTELLARPLNDVGNALTQADVVHAGTGITPADGTGVLIAIADSGLDLSHPDLPSPVEAYDVTEGNVVATWGADVRNTVSDHGTHVTGSAVGRGTASAARAAGDFRGAAPGASLAFYKIGNDITASSSTNDEIKAIDRAASIGADVFTMSYGGISTYMDGSDSAEQAIDAAVAGGMLVFISAGNEGDADLHDSELVAPGTTSPSIGFTVTNSSTIDTLTDPLTLRVIWRDDVPGDANVTLAADNLGAGEAISLVFTGTSPRATEGRRYQLVPNIPPAGSKTYNLLITNAASTGTTPRVHLYDVAGAGQFAAADPAYTVSSPALADSALAVGAWVQRSTWTSWTGGFFSFSGSGTGLANFSSRGPRIDGVMKPDIAAPGSATISLLDSDVPETASALLIDDDGSNDSTGPTHYCVKQGTSMASPHAAGVAALLKQAKPTATVTELRDALTSTASQSGAPDNNAGYGLIHAFQGVLTVPVELSSFSID